MSLSLSNLIRKVLFQTRRSQHRNVHVTPPEPDEGPGFENLEERILLSHFLHTYDDINPNNSDLDSFDPDGASMGRIGGLASVVGDNRTLYAASEFGGVFKSSDRGVNWDHLDGHLPQVTWDVEVDPSNPNRVYASSFYDGRVNPITGIQVSNDGGITWTHPLTSHADPALEGTANDNTPQVTYSAINARRTEPAAYGIAIRPDAPNNVAIGTNAGLAISNDSGATWRIVDPTPGNNATNIWDVIWQPGGANGTIDVVGDSGHHRSTDGGGAWTANSLPGGATGLTSMSIAASPDESYVLYVVGVDNALYESIDADQAVPTWTLIGATDPTFGGGRLPFVATNNTTTGFDVWTGGVSLYRATGTTPANPQSGVGGSRINAPAAWAGPFTRDGSPLPPPASQAAHDDVGDIVFDTEVPNDAIPVLFSSDGGVYVNTAIGDVAGATNNILPIIITTAAPHGLAIGNTVRISNVQGNTNANGTFPVLPLTPTTFSIPVLGNGNYVTGTGHWHLVSQTPRWEQPNVGPHAEWLFGMTSLDRTGAANEDIYYGTQDIGSFANTSAGAANPAASWHNQDCCDVFDLAVDGNGTPANTADDTVLYTVGAFNMGRGFRLYLGNSGLGASAEVNTYPGNVAQAAAAAASGGQVTVFNFAESIARFGNASYAMLTRDGGGFGDGGLHITTNINAAPIVWTELIGNTGDEPFNSANVADLQVAITGGTPSFFVTVGDGNSYTADQLWRFDGTNPNGVWQQLDTNIDPGDVGGGVSLFAVDPNDPNRLYASYIDPASGPRMVFSTDGGQNWNADANLDFMMTGGGTFQYSPQRGPRNFPDQEGSAAPARGIGVYYQPTLLAFDPEDSSIIAAGAMDAGVFLSTDSGASWRLLTDPFGTDDDPTTTLASGLPLDDNPHIPRPRFAHFDHETDDVVDLYVGTQGRGVWRIGVNFDKEPDRFEPNNSIGSATVLGSLQKITLNDLSIHDVNDVDVYQYTAQDTGKLIINMFHDGLSGDLDLRVRDASGNIVTTATQGNAAPPTLNEQLVIPVVSQEHYYIEVFSSVGHTNCYDLEIENFPAPVPITIDLAAADDTGMMNDDNVTSDDEGTITILADLFDFADMGIDILTPSEVAANEAGAAVEVFVRGQSVGIANPVAGSNNTLFTFQFSAGDLSEGLNVVTAAVRIFDGQNPQQDGRSQMSEPLLLTLDTTAPATPAAPDLLAASDTGMNDDDNVTAKMRPAFDGSTESNAKVRVKADGVVVGEGVATASGDWEVTVEPLDDGVYDITVEAEDLAGNVSTMSSALQVEIDSLQPNTALLDLVEVDDSGRHNDDNITNVNTPLLSATTHDPNAGIHLFADNFKYRIYDRLEETVEVLLYDSFAEAPGFTSLNQIFTTANLLSGNTILGPLADGIHNLKLEVEDRAGNISEDFLLEVLIDTVAPDGTLELHPDSDSGIWGYAETMEDLVTNDMTPMFYGVTEADALVRVDIDDVAGGTTVAVPLDGDDAFPPPPEYDGTYLLQTILNLEDGEHTIEAFFRDVAGNESPASDDATVTLLVDTAGPRITNVTRGQVSTDNVFSFDGVTSLFEPKPSPTGPDPLIHSIVVHFSDLPDRTAAFADVEALFLALAEEECNYQIVGDHNGNIAIVDVNVTFTTIADDGEPETAEVELVLDAPLPDDRFTLSVSDSISDPAGNPLDGESGAQAPFDGNNIPDDTPPIFPTGDGEHGGDFHARFTVDSRPEIGTFALGTSYIDINGNFVFDPEGKDRDQTNRDIVFIFGQRDDAVFAGNFSAEGAGSATGYDKLGSYGVTDGKGQPAWHWRLDFDHDGVVDYEVVSGKQISGDPVAGDFDPTHPGDEIGLFSAGTWFLDTTGNNNIGDPGDLKIKGDMRGLPVVGDFDGDGLDDLGVWDRGNEGLRTQGKFLFDLAADGLTGDTEHVIELDLAGVFEKPVAADMNEDGIDDLGLFVTRREAVTPEESAEWFFLISDVSLQADGEVTALDHRFTPVPFGNDIFAQFGDERAAPVVGNFDPPVTPLKPTTNESPNSLANQGTSTSASESEPALVESAVTYSDVGAQPDIAFTESELAHTSDDPLNSPETRQAPGRTPGSEPEDATVPSATPLADITIREAVATSTGSIDGSGVVASSRYSSFTMPLAMGGAYGMSRSTATTGNSQWPSGTRALSISQTASGRRISGETGAAGTWTYDLGDWNWEIISFTGNGNRISRIQQNNDIAPAPNHGMPDTYLGDMMMSLSALSICTFIVLGGLTVIRIILEPRTSRV